MILSRRLLFVAIPILSAQVSAQCEDKNERALACVGSTSYDTEACGECLEANLPSLSPAMCGPYETACAAIKNGEAGMTDCIGCTLELYESFMCSYDPGFEGCSCPEECYDDSAGSAFLFPTKETC